MDAQRNLFIAFAVRELQVETLGDCKIHLIRHQREFPADRAPDLYVDLRPVERGLIFCFHIGNTAIRSLHGGPSLPF